MSASKALMMELGMVIMEEEQIKMTYWEGPKNNANPKIIVMMIVKFMTLL